MSDAHADDTRAAPGRRQADTGAAGRIGELLAEVTAAKPEIDWKQRCRDLIGIPPEQMTKGVADLVISHLEGFTNSLELAADAEETDVDA